MKVPVIIPAYNRSNVIIRSLKTWAALLYSFAFNMLILFGGMLIFNKVEKSFMDVV